MAKRERPARERPDEVHVIMAVREQQKRTSRLYKVSERFQLSPISMHLITPKPTLVDPRKGGELAYKATVLRDPIAEAFSNSRIERSIATGRLTPNERYKSPQTSAQEYGWFNSELIPKPRSSSNMHYRPRTPCMETSFAEEYLKQKKICVFKVKSKV